MTAATKSDTRSTGWRRLGRANLVYLGFALSLIPIVGALELFMRRGPDEQGIVIVLLLMWPLVTLVFFLVNLVRTIRALVRRASPWQPLLGCALPVAMVLLGFGLERIFLAKG